jgi:hypothetical protein
MVVQQIRAVRFSMPALMGVVFAPLQARLWIKKKAACRHAFTAPPP